MVMLFHAHALESQLHAMVVAQQTLAKPYLALLAYLEKRALSLALA
jgi:hypothetical protein